jgi:hypothetical protein
MPGIYQVVFEKVFEDFAWLGSSLAYGHDLNNFCRHQCQDALDKFGLNPSSGFIGGVVYRKLLTDERRRTTDAERRPVTIDHHEPKAQMS